MSDIVLIATLHNFAFKAVLGSRTLKKRLKMTKTGLSHIHNIILLYNLGNLTLKNKKNSWSY